MNKLVYLRPPLLWCAGGCLILLLALLLPARPTRAAGSVTSAGDALLRADLARALTGLSGRGVRVGVISDGIDGAAASQATGDLPPDCPPAPELACLHMPPATLRGSGSEGRAMLEIIHDLAPGAQLAFASGNADSAQFVAAVEYLQGSVGAGVIVDDLGFLSEPFFEDGPIAVRLEAAVAAGVVVVSAAGNEAQAHYQARLDAPTTGQVLFERLHRFAPDDTTQSALLAPGQSVNVVLQWDNPFDDPFNTKLDDLNLYVRADGEIVAQSTTSQATERRPLEFVRYTNSSTGTQQVEVFIEALHLKSDPPPLIALVFASSPPPEYVTPADSVFGHPAARGVLAVGAVEVATPARVAPYSARGPATISQPQPEQRAKPDVVAATCVATSVPAYRTFCGTSAAAPHVAAVAALLREYAPQASPAQVAAWLRSTAQDIEAAGVDPVAGAGLVDAQAALRAAGALPEPIWLPLLRRP